MREVLFKNLDRNNDPLWIVKEFFNSINNIFFLRTTGYLVEGTSYGNEYSDCDFPGDLEEGEELFEGVRFRYHDDEIIVSEEKFKECLTSAFKLYEEINPDKSSEIKDLLSRL